MAGRPGTGIQRVARIDLGAFAANLESALGSGDDLVWDARANAYGHGLAALLPVALDAGIRTIRVTPGEEVGFVGVPRSTFMTVSTVRPLLVDSAYGIGDDSLAVMTLSAEVLAVKIAEAGVGVSYGYTYRTARRTTLALVGLGFADGVPRLASNRASVWIDGHRHPIVGRIAMDQFVVDCGELAPEVGDEVVLFGPSALGFPSVHEWAEATERRPLDLTAGLGARIRRDAS